MGIGPVAAVKKLFDRAGFSIDDIDLIESNEAFAAQSLAVIQEGKLDPSAPLQAIQRYDLFNVNAGTSGNAGGDA